MKFNAEWEFLNKSEMFQNFKNLGTIITKIMFIMKLGEEKYTQNFCGETSWKVD
jgi:hypothetical protein